MPSWRPFSPPFGGSGARPGSCRTRPRAPGCGWGGMDAPSAATTRPISPLRDDRHRRLAHGVLPEPVTEVQAGRKRVRLIARLTVECRRTSWPGARSVREKRFTTMPTWRSRTKTAPARIGEKRNSAASKTDEVLPQERQHRLDHGFEGAPWLSLRSCARDSRGGPPWERTRGNRFLLESLPSTGIYESPSPRVSPRAASLWCVDE